MFKKLAITAAAAALAVPAFAGNPNTPGAIQMSYEAGVTPGVYDVAQLQRLQEARSNGDMEAVNFILSQGADTPVNTMDATSGNAGKAQLAAIAGVNADDFTVAQLDRLIDAQRDGDKEEVRFILSQSGSFVEGDVVSTSSVPSQGAQMLGKLTGKDAATTPLSELVGDDL